MFRVDMTELFSNYLVSRDHQIDWMTQSLQTNKGGVLRINDNERVILCSSISEITLFSRLINLFLEILHDIRIVKQAYQCDYDAIQVRDKVFASLAGLFSARLQRIKFFYWMSYPYVEADYYKHKEKINSGHWLKAFYYWIKSKVAGIILYRIVIPHADHVFVQSKKMLKEVAKFNVAETKITIVPMGVTVGQTPIEPVEDERLIGKLPVIYLGTMLRIRRIDYLIDAFSIVVKTVPSAIFIIVGGGESEDIEYVKRHIVKLGIQDNVILTGFIQRDLAWKYVKASKVSLSVLPPIYLMDLSSPTKVVEYLSHQVPVIVNDVGDQATLIRQSNAGVVVSYDRREIAQAIIDVLSDQRNAVEMGKKGREYIILNRSYEIISKQLEKEYYRILGT